MRAASFGGYSSLLLRLYGLSRDYIGTQLTSSTFLAWDDPRCWSHPFCSNTGITATYRSRNNKLGGAQASPNGAETTII
jgi:hypothetical protein